MNDLKSHIDFAAFIATTLSLIQFVPVIVGVIASCLSIVWYGIRIYEYVRHGRVKD